MLGGVPPELLVSLFGFDLWMLSSWILGAVELLLGRQDRSLDWENRLVETRRIILTHTLKDARDVRSQFNHHNQTRPRQSKRPCPYCPRIR
jgi:hypothetical protein